ncbi:hypothetical protein SAMN02745181_0345 [Rubritalea squalenifaciens DSM 18772]|uniref:Uncharacterized protein n=1 Tax=Rubritalea squalenifaciens DSM 18772 TaxID=1123071 RepID=A0A1M6BYT1_9BACT|nr:hypothetical protein [Rubritalea squalenifaciens]SHI53955.1 hypothetical protein SAMN02745181_0345 [Rubritalea squalenifaciens DSM 18772]
MEGDVLIAVVYAASEFLPVVRLLHDEGAPSAYAEGSVAYGVMVKEEEAERAVEILHKHWDEFDYLDILGKDDSEAPVYMAEVQCAQGLTDGEGGEGKGGTVFCFVTARDGREVIQRLEKTSCLKRWKMHTVTGVHLYTMGTEEWGEAGFDSLADAARKGRSVETTGVMPMGDE